MTKKYISLLVGLLLAGYITTMYAQTHNYAEVLQKSMFFYECQESGPLSPDNRVTWRSHSAVNDGSDVGRNLTGGWYDAGDHVKFNFPMAFSATALAWGAIDFADGYVASGQMPFLKRNLRFVNDYFIKCHTAPNELWGQVGNGGLDHAWWGSAEVMQMQRPAYKIDATNPGSDLAAETAAAMAAASIVFQADDPSYSATLLTHAIQLYNFADTYRGVYSNSITDAAGYYRSFSGYNDELVWGAIWLYRATGDATYLAKAETYYANLSNEPQSTTKSFKWGLAWDDKSYGCYALLAKLTGNAQYKTDIERHLDYWTDGYNGQRITYTPGGLAFLDVWGALRYANNTSFLAVYYHDAATTAAKSTKYYNFALSQVNYTLGNNPRNSSYVCGYGNNPPKNPHHRTAHGCWSNNHNGPPAETRHILYGALVGGPGSNDGYTDERSNYVNNEVACDYNACFSGLLAKLVDDFGGSQLNNFPVAETPTGEFFIEARLNASGATHTEWAVWVNNHTAWPARIGNQHKFRLFIDITEGLAAGYTPQSYVVSANSSNVTFTPLIAWDEDDDIYYTEVTFNPTILIWPGGQGESRKEAQIRIRLPFDANPAAWNPSNDWSSQGVDGTLKQTPNIPLYVDGNLVFGNTPDGGVIIPVTGVTVSPSTAALDVNETRQLTATVVPGNASDKSVTWSSSNSAIATVSASGVVRGVSEGTASITATTADGGFTASSTVTVTDVVVTQYTITTSVNGSGTVTLNPSGGTYNAGTQVTITATPSSGFQFDNWSGGLTGSTNPVTVTLNANLTVTANFSEIQGTDCDNPTSVALPHAQNGVGEFCWVTSGNISFVNSWNMTLLEINGVDYTNTWSNSMPPRIDGNYYIRYVATVGWAHAEINGSGGGGDPQQFTVTTSVTGSGSVSINPPGGTYNEGSAVTLTATPAAGFQFTNWSGGASGSANPLSVTVNANLSITANFTEISEPDQFTLTTSVTGSGSVTLNPPGGMYDEGTVVTLTATPAANFTFSGWSGAVSGTANPVTVTMDGNKSVTAAFTSNPGDPACASPVTISLPFARNGTGESCFVTTGNISYINSWNTTLVEVNGVNFTNVWSNSLPPRINGAYYIRYVGAYGWSHFEAAGSNAGARFSISEPSSGETEALLVYPNPVPVGKSMTIDLGETGISGDAVITIIDHQGRTLLTRTAGSKGQITIDMPLRSGLHQLRVMSNGQQVLTRKVLVVD